MSADKILRVLINMKKKKEEQERGKREEGEQPRATLGQR